MGNMASEATFDNWKLVFSWRKVRKRAITQNPLMGRFWSLGIKFTIYFCARKWKKITMDNFFFSWCMFRTHVGAAQTRSDRADRKRCVISSLFTNTGAALLTEPVWLPDCAGRAEEARCFRLLLQVWSCWKWNLFHCFCCQCYDMSQTGQPIVTENW